MGGARASTDGPTVTTPDESRVRRWSGVLPSWCDRDRGNGVALGPWRLADGRERGRLRSRTGCRIPQLAIRRFRLNEAWGTGWQRSSIAQGEHPAWSLLSPRRRALPRVVISATLDDGSASVVGTRNVGNRASRGEGIWGDARGAKGASACATEGERLRAGREPAGPGRSCFPMLYLAIRPSAQPWCDRGRGNGTACRGALGIVGRVRVQARAAFASGFRWSSEGQGASRDVARRWASLLCVM